MKRMSIFQFNFENDNLLIKVFPGDLKKMDLKQCRQ